MGNRTGKDPGDGICCDWCKIAEALGTFFVPGKGILNLCGRCRLLLMAVLIDEM